MFVCVCLLISFYTMNGEQGWIQRGRWCCWWLTETVHLALDGELVHVLLLDLGPPRLLRLVQLRQSLGDARRPLARRVTLMTSNWRHDWRHRVSVVHVIGVTAAQIVTPVIDYFRLQNTIRYTWWRPPTIVPWPEASMASNCISNSPIVQGK